MSAMLEPMLGERQCSKCLACYPLRCFENNKRQCRACKNQYCREHAKKKPRVRRKVESGNAWLLPSDPRTLDQQLHALRQQKWRYPVESACNLRAVL